MCKPGGAVGPKYSSDPDLSRDGLLEFGAMIDHVERIRGHFADSASLKHEAAQTMAAPIEAMPSTEPGVYRFKTNLMMAGGWRLSLGAKIQGETGTLENKLVLKAVP